MDCLGIFIGEISLFVAILYYSNLINIAINKKSFDFGLILFVEIFV